MFLSDILVKYSREKCIPILWVEAFPEGKKLRFRKYICVDPRFQVGADFGKLSFFSIEGKKGKTSALTGL